MRAPSEDDATVTFSSLPEEINPNKTAIVRALGPVDLSVLRPHVLAMPESAWDKADDFEANYNKTGAIRSASHCIFRFCDRRQSPYRYVDLEAWQTWTPLLLPVMQAAVRPYGYARGFFPRIMLARLPGGSFIPPHVDGEPRVSVPHKIHVPITTNPQVYFFVAGERFHLEEGAAFEVNNAARHSVVNGGESARIHLIFEYLDADLQPSGK